MQLLLHRDLDVAGDPVDEIGGEDRRTEEYDSDADQQDAGREQPHPTARPPRADRRMIPGEVDVDADLDGAYIDPGRHDATVPSM